MLHASLWFQIYAYLDNDRYFLKLEYDVPYLKGWGWEERLLSLLNCMHVQERTLQHEHNNLECYKSKTYNVRHSFVIYLMGRLFSFVSWLMLLDSTQAPPLVQPPTHLLILSLFHPLLSSNQHPTHSPIRSFNVLGNFTPSVIMLHPTHVAKLSQTMLLKY